ncbi:MAG: DNA cytosine methyltransferase [Saprospiraceae bacterium]|nr:DNA cytosine methyltransferase [Saprospiraceae bacterium]
MGLHNAGINTFAAIEQDKFAAETFKINFPKAKVYQRDITTFSNEEIKSKFSKIDIIVGGPPCQGFSVAGPYKFGILDDRNNLVQEYLRFVSVINPNICVLENVKNIMNGKLKSKQSVIEHVLEHFDKLEYNVKIYTLFAPNFGVPQSRTRVFIIAIKKKSKIEFPEIIETHGTKKAWVTVSEALDDLPLIDSGEGFDLEPNKFNYNFKPKSDYQKLMRINSNGIYNHVAMQHTKRLIERFKHIPQGGSLLDVPTEHGQRQRNGSKLDEKPRFKMNNQRLDPKNISQCVTASFQSTFVHPKLDRNLTAREGARLQSFPDTFIFTGPRTLMSKTLLIREKEDEIGLSQYNQIGNAVPPLLAEAIESNIKSSFKIE